MIRRPFPCDTNPAGHFLDSTLEAWPCGRGDPKGCPHGFVKLRLIAWHKWNCTIVTANAEFPSHSHCSPFGKPGCLESLGEPPFPMGNGSVFVRSTGRLKTLGPIFPPSHGHNALSRLGRRLLRERLYGVRSCQICDCVKRLGTSLAVVNFDEYHRPDRWLVRNCSRGITI